jgi:hypothetical protein
VTDRRARASRALILLVLAGCTAFLAACGKSSYHAHAGGSPTTAASAATASPLTKARALAAARAVNLTAADLPGFTVSSRKQTKTTQEKGYERELLRCLGPQAAGTQLAEAGSKDYELSHGILQLGVSSEVSIAPTPAMASAKLAAVRSPRVRGCFAHYFERLLKGQRYAGAAIGPVSLASGTPPAAGTTGGFGWRVTATLDLHGVRVSFYLDILGFVYGPATVMLFSTGALEPFPAAAQQHLFGVLLGRAKAHIS